MKTLAKFATAATCVSLGWATTEAAGQTIEVRGTFDNAYSEYNVFSQTLNQMLGQEFVLTFEYDAAQEDRTPWGDNGLYLHNTPPYRMTLECAGATVTETIRYSLEAWGDQSRYQIRSDSEVLDVSGAPAPPFGTGFGMTLDHVVSPGALSFLDPSGTFEPLPQTPFFLGESLDQATVGIAVARFDFRDVIADYLVGQVTSIDVINRWHFEEEATGQVLATMDLAGEGPFDHTDLRNFEWTAAGAAWFGVQEGPAQAPFTQTFGQIAVELTGQLSHDPSATLAYMETPFLGYDFAGGGSDDAISVLWYNSAPGDAEIYVGVDRNGPNSTSADGIWQPEGGPICVGDTDGDGDIDLSDLATVLGQFGQTGNGLGGDIDRDGDVDLSDLAALLGEFGRGCP